jgi:uncharacterized membrane protein
MKAETLSRLRNKECEMTTATHYTGIEPVERWAETTEEWRGSRAGNDGAERLSRALGLFSIGLGLSQILAPRGVARAIGLEDDDRNHKLMTAFGIREIATGLGLLSRPDSAAFAWGRVAGDAMDLAVLGKALASSRNDHNRVAAAAAAVLGVTVLDIIAGKSLSRGTTETPAAERQRDRRIRVIKAITVNSAPEEAYRLWRNFENLPRFMAHLESVRVMDDRRSYWKAKAPLGATVEWTAEITEDRPAELIAWRSLEGAEVTNSGQVRFTPLPGDRGTEVRVELSYDPPGGLIGATVARLFGEEPSVQVDGDLRRFKQVLELGEVVHSDASIHRGMHPARPSHETPPLASTFQGASS